MQTSCVVPYDGPEPRDGFLFEHLKWPAESTSLDELRPLFQTLPPDPFLPAPSFRLRKHSLVTGGRGSALKATESFILQGDENRLFSGVKRHFEPLQPAWLASKARRAFLAVVDAFKTAAELPSEAPVHVHAIRTLAEPGTAGEPAPEGVHRDGYRVLGIFVIERCRIEGAVTELYKTKGARPIFSGVLHPGDFVLVNDRVGGVFHYTSPMTAEKPPLAGYRDVLVLLY